MILILAGVVTAGGLSAGLAAPETQKIPLTRDLDYVCDVRWASRHEILIAAGRKGGYVVDLLTMGEKDATIGSRVQDVEIEPMFWAKLGASGQYTVVSDFAISMTWVGRTNQQSWTHQSPRDLNAIIDLDVHRDQMIWIGATREPGGLLCPDGSMAWISTLPEFDPVPVHGCEDGGGCYSLDTLGFMELSHVRFLADGSFVVVPGTDDGMYLYSPNRRLERFWSNQELGVTPMDDATISAVDVDLRAQYAGDELFRHQEWINKRSIIDEVVQIGDELYIVVRSTNENVVSWSLSKLDRSTGAVTQVQSYFPVSHHPVAHLRADWFFGRLAVLIYTYPNKDGEPPGTLLIQDWR